MDELILENLKVDLLDNNATDCGLLRTSTQRQQDVGDPLPIQKEKIEYSANKNNLRIGLWLEFAQSASGKFETQPLLAALRYLESMPTIKRVWISIVNRATRGELFDFLMVQRAFAKKGIELVDAQGELSQELRDSLESFDVKYKFNQYDSNEQKMINSILAARTNWRENLTQLHSAEIKYARLGYWVLGKTPFGFKKVRTKTIHGKRYLLEIDETKSLWVKTMFDLSLKKAPKTVITDQVNILGYQSAQGKKLTVKQLDKILVNPIYCMVRNSKSQQTGGKAVKIFGTPYISVEQYNEINQGKFRIIETPTTLKVIKGSSKSISKHSSNPLYPFKRFVLCPICNHKLLGSAPKGRHGGIYPQYHCGNNHPYWHVPVKDFDNTILEFTKNLKLTDVELAKYKERLLSKVQGKLVTIQGVSINYQQRVMELEEQSKNLLIKIRASKLLIVQQDLESELEKVEAAKDEAIAEWDKMRAQQINIRMVIDGVMYILEHLEKGLLGIADPIKRAAAWSTIFEELPTYQDLVSRTPRLRPHIEQINTPEQSENYHVHKEGLISNPFESIIQQYLALKELGVFNEELSIYRGLIV